MPFLNNGWAFLAALSLSSAIAAAEEKTFADEWSSLRQIERQTDRNACREAFRALVAQSPKDNFLRVKEAWCDMPSDATWNALRGISVVRPQLPWPHLGMARVYSFWKMPVQASESLRNALRAQSQFFPALVELGELARQEGRMAEAASFYKKALALHDEALAHAGLGLVELAQGRLDSAAQSLETAYKKDAQEVIVLEALFRLSLQRGELSKAVSYLFQRAQLQSQDLVLWQELARLAMANESKTEAIVALEKLIELNAANVSTFESLSRLYFQTERFVDEERVLEAWLSHGSIGAPGVLRLSELAQRRNALEKAEGFLLAAVSRIDSPELWLDLGRVQRKRERFVEAVDSHRKAAMAKGTTGQTAQKELLELRALLGISEKPNQGTPQRVLSTIDRSLKRFNAALTRESVSSECVMKGRIRLDDTGRFVESTIDENTLSDARLVGHVLVQLREARYESKAAEVTFEFRLKEEKRHQ